jgi:hypothetical protein
MTDEAMDAITRAVGLGRAGDAARTHLAAATTYLGALGDDEYGRTIRGALDGVGAAIDAGSTERQATAP